MGKDLPASYAEEYDAVMGRGTSIQNMSDEEASRFALTIWNLYFTVRSYNEDQE